MINASLLSIIAFLAAPALSQENVDDRDLSGPAKRSVAPLLDMESVVERGVRYFPARLGPGGFAGPQGSALTGEIHLNAPNGDGVPARRVKVILSQNGQVLAAAQTDDSGRFSLTPPAGASGEAAVRFTLENKWWSVADARSRNAYVWQAATVQLPLPGAFDIGIAHPAPGTENEKIPYIHLQYLEALDLFERQASAAWWRQAYKVLYPSDADYYVPQQKAVHLTNAAAWDVNLHELGHGIIFQGTRSSPAGGQHKIDECYNQALAWSEGAATFIAAAAHLSPRDPDAKFEFLVPRRAPIRIEHVPADVCKGTANEWRVGSALWDLYDENGDGEDAVAIAFGRLWKSLESQPINGFPAAYRLIEAGLSAQERALASAALKQNTMIPAAPLGIASLESVEAARPLLSR